MNQNNEYYTPINAAIKAGDLHLLIILHLQGYKWDEHDTETAAGHGHLNCLRYLYENGCPCNGYAFRYAAWNGHLECIKYLHEHGCKKDTSWAVSVACMNGHLDCVKYLCENGHKWCTFSLICALNHTDCLKYLLQATKSTFCQNLDQPCCSGPISNEKYELLKEFLYQSTDDINRQKLNNIYICRKNWQKI